MEEEQANVQAGPGFVDFSICRVSNTGVPTGEDGVLVEIPWTGDE